MKKLLILGVIGYIFLALVMNGQDNCTHLTGADYDRCNISQVRGR